MKKLFIISIAFAIVSCGVQTKIAMPKIVSINYISPELNVEYSEEIGNTLVSEVVGVENKFNVIRISKGIKVRVGYVLKEIKEGDIYIYGMYTSKYNLYINRSDPTFGIAIPKSGGQVKIYNNNGIGITFVNIKYPIEYSDTFQTTISSVEPYLKQEFIYNGRVNNALKFTYREYNNGTAIPAFTQDLQYDLAESKIIGFKGLRIEVINATNTKIDYKVLSRF